MFYLIVLYYNKINWIPSAKQLYTNSVIFFFSLSITTFFLTLLKMLLKNNLKSFLDQNFHSKLFFIPFLIFLWNSQFLNILFGKFFYVIHLFFCSDFDDGGSVTDEGNEAMRIETDEVQCFKRGQRVHSRFMTFVHRELESTQIMALFKL